MPIKLLLQRPIAFPIATLWIAITLAGSTAQAAPCASAHQRQNWEQLMAEVGSGPRRREFKVELRVAVPNALISASQMEPVRAWMLATRNLETEIHLQSDRTLKIHVAGQANRIEAFLTKLSAAFLPENISWRPENQADLQSSPTSIPDPEQPRRRVRHQEEQPTIDDFPGAPLIPTRRHERPSRASVERESGVPAPPDGETSKRLLLDAREISKKIKSEEDLADLQSFLEAHLQWALPSPKTDASQPDTFEIAYVPRNTRTAALLVLGKNTDSGGRPMVVVKDLTIMSESEERVFWRDLAVFHNLRRSELQLYRPIEIGGSVREWVTISPPVLGRMLVKYRLPLEMIEDVVRSVGNVVPGNNGVFSEKMMRDGREFLVLLGQEGEKDLKVINIFPRAVTRPTDQ